MDGSEELYLLERIKEIQAILYKDIFHDISAGEFLTLHLIWKLRNEAVQTSRLAELSHVSAQAVSRALNILEAKELIRREINRADRRSIRISLTDKGLEVYEQDKQQIEAFLRCVRTDMGEERLATMIELLQEFSQACRRAALQESIS